MYTPYVYVTAIDICEWYTKYSPLTIQKMVISYTYTNTNINMADIASTWLSQQDFVISSQMSAHGQNSNVLNRHMEHNVLNRQQL